MPTKQTIETFINEVIVGLTWAEYNGWLEQEGGPLAEKEVDEVLAWLDTLHP